MGSASTNLGLRSPQNGSVAKLSRIMREEHAHALGFTL
jgi:hypothetical protein